MVVSGVGGERRWKGEGGSEREDMVGEHRRRVRKLRRRKVKNENESVDGVEKTLGRRLEFREPSEASAARVH